MRISELKTYVEGQVVYKFLVNNFHARSQDDSCVIVLSSNGGSEQHVSNLLFQFLVRAKDPEVAETKAYELFKLFDGKSDFLIGSDSVVLSRGQQAIPLYTGTDEADRHIYSVNIIAIVDKN